PSLDKNSTCSFREKWKAVRLVVGGQPRVLAQWVEICFGTTDLRKSLFNPRGQRIVTRMERKRGAEHGRGAQQNKPGQVRRRGEQGASKTSTVRERNTGGPSGISCGRVASQREPCPPSRKFSTRMGKRGEKHGSFPIVQKIKVILSSSKVASQVVKTR
ncbi:unnamed protein product, partial [Ectocarpus sp. 12 AP-2014]